MFSKAKNIISSSSIMLCVLLVFLSHTTSAAKKSEEATKNEKVATFLSLEDAVLLALRYNPEIETAKLDRVIQKWNLRIAQNDFELQYTLSGGVSNIYNRTENQGTVSRSGTSASLSPSVKWKSSIGTTVNFDVGQGFDGKHHTGDATVTVKQPLWKGFGRDVNLAGLRSSYESEHINKLELRDSIGTSILKIVNSYRGLIQNNYNIETTSKSLEDLKKSIKITKGKIDAGKEPPTNLIEAEARLGDLELQVEQSAVAADTAEQELLFQIGLDPNRKIEAPKDVEIKELKAPDVDETIEKALQNNTGYQSKLLGFEQAKRSLMLAKDRSSWGVSLSATGTLGGGGMGRMVDGRTHSESVSLSLDVPIQDLSLKKAVVEAKINLEKQQISLDNAKRKLITEIKQQVLDIKSQIQQIKLAKNNFKLTQKSYDNEVVKKGYGKSSEITVTQAQDKLTGARNSVIIAKVGYLKGVDDLNQALGLTLEKWNIELKY